VHFFLTKVLQTLRVVCYTLQKSKQIHRSIRVY
jgi:hypothetical protein